MSTWFGASWGAPVCDPADHTPTPVGVECAHCDLAIRPDDQGIILPLLAVAATGEHSVIVYHLACFLKTVTSHKYWADRGLKPAIGDGFEIVPGSGGNVLRCGCSGIGYDIEKDKWV